MSKRNRIIDFFKGIAMFLCIYGHCLQYAFSHSLGITSFYSLSVFRFIYSFHMPFFIIFSGFLLGKTLRKRNYGDNLRHRIGTLFWAILVSNILWVLIVDIPRLLQIFMDGSIATSRVRLSAILNQESLSNFWFLWAVLACSLASIIIFQRMKNIQTKCLAVFFLWMISICFPNGHLIFTMYPFFLLGSIVGIYSNLHSIPKLPFWIEGFIILSFLLLMPFYKEQCFIYRPIYLPSLNLTQKLSVYVIRLGCGVLGSLSIIIVLLKARAYAKLYRVFSLCWLGGFLHALSDFCVFVGKNSLKYYVIQSILMDSGYFTDLICIITTKIPGTRIIYSSLIGYQLLFAPAIALVIIGIVSVIVWRASKFSLTIPDYV